MLKKIIQIILSMIFISNIICGPVSSNAKLFKNFDINTSNPNNTLSIQSSLLNNEEINPIAMQELFALYHYKIITDQDLLNCLHYLYESSKHTNPEGFLKFAVKLIMQTKYPYLNIKSIKILEKTATITTDNGIQFSYSYAKQERLELQSEIKTTKDLRNQIKRIKENALTIRDRRYDFISLYKTLEDKELITNFRDELKKLGEDFEKLIPLMIEAYFSYDKFDNKIFKFIYEIYKKHNPPLNFDHYLKTEPDWFRYLRKLIFEIKKSQFKQAEEVDITKLEDYEKDLIAYFLAKNFTYIVLNLEEDFLQELVEDINNDVKDDGTKPLKEKFNKFLMQVIPRIPSEDINDAAKKIAYTYENKKLIIETLDKFRIAEIFAKHLEVEELKLAGETRLERVVRFLSDNFDEGVISDKIAQLNEEIDNAEKKEITKDTNLKELLKDENLLILEVMFKKVDDNLLKQLLEQDKFHAFIWAAENGHIEIVKFLVKLAKKIEDGGEAGFVKNMFYVDHKSFFIPLFKADALNKAVENGHIEIVKFLVKLAKK